MRSALPAGTVQVRTVVPLRVKEVGITVDGVHLTGLLNSYRFKTSLFSFSYPANNVMGVKGPGTTKSAADAIIVSVAPLAPGQHSVDPSFRFAAPVNMAGTITYDLTVRG